MSEWETVPLCDLLEPGRSISYGIVQPGAHTIDGIPIVRAGDVHDGSVDISAPLRVSPAVESPFGRTRLRGGELLITLVGSVGNTAVAPPNIAGWNVARAVGVVPIDPRIGANWVRYALKHSAVAARIEQRLNTTVQATLNLRELSELPVPMPPEPQRSGAEYVLIVIDDRIEVNRRMVATLEEIFRALFKSWFVDFDPVRAKAEGRDPGMAIEVADLFPDRLVDSPLGAIPAGWETGRVGDRVSSQSVRVKGRTAEVLSAVSSGRLVRSSDHFNKRVHSVDIGKYLAVEVNDIAYNPSRINIGSVGQLRDDVLGAVSPVYVVARPRPGWAHYVRRVLDLPSTKETIKTLATGSVRQSLSFDNFASLPMVLPPEQAVLAFNRVYLDLEARIRHVECSVAALSELRDSLLPKLVSGRIRISDPEDFLARMEAVR